MRFKPWWAAFGPWAIVGHPLFRLLRCIPVGERMKDNWPLYFASGFSIGNPGLLGNAIPHQERESRLGLALTPLSRSSCVTTGIDRNCF